jgi:sulfide:quinone oxidoreductase
VSWDEREVPFDLLVTIPLHGGPAYGRSTSLGDEFGFVRADPHTLQSNAAPNVFAIGDATNLPTSKAGSVTHFEGETLVENIRRFLDGEQLEASFDGHANCFIETGFQKALMIDFNYEVEPLPGRFPEPHVGPLPLLKESRLNHIAKLLFQWVYWHVLLPGHDIPGVGSQLQRSGRETAGLATNQGEPR